MGATVRVTVVAWSCQEASGVHIVLLYLSIASSYMAIVPVPQAPKMTVDTTADKASSSPCVQRAYHYVLRDPPVWRQNTITVGSAIRSTNRGADH